MYFYIIYKNIIQFIIYILYEDIIYNNIYIKCIYIYYLYFFIKLSIFWSILIEPDETMMAPILVYS